MDSSTLVLLPYDCKLRVLGESLKNYYLDMISHVKLVFTKKVINFHITIWCTKLWFFSKCY